MKRLIAAVVTLSALVTLNAQNADLARILYDNDYTGSARSTALGNAVTALGGDPGMAVINPAGSAVSSYSQFSITPGLYVSTMRSGYAPVGGYDENYATGETHSWDESTTRFVLPNIGFILNLDMYSSPVKNMAFGFMANSTGCFIDRGAVDGINDQYTSLLGSLAYECSYDGSGSYNPYSEEELNRDYGNDIYWPYQLAYKSGMIRHMDDGTYLGATEVDRDGDIMVGGPLRQYYTRYTYGIKTDMVVNWAVNFNDRLLLGINLGVPVLSYTSEYSQTEKAISPEDFEYVLNDQLTHFCQSSMNSYESVTARGIYGKFGLQWSPLDFLRVGAAIQTPTSMQVVRRMRWDGNTRYDNLQASSVTPLGEESYRVTVPFRYNLGVAVTIAKMMLLSVDWESTPQTAMRYRNWDGATSSDYTEINDYLSRYGGNSNSIRAGFEAKPLDWMSIRIGYSRNARIYRNEGGNDKDVTSTYSVGFGYSSPRSFYFDITGRFRKYPREWYYPYDDYIFDERGNLLCGTPELSFDKIAGDVLLTLGWRF